MRQVYLRIKKIADEIIKLGGFPVLTGGCVRDFILGKKIKDIDLEVFFLEKETLEECLSQFEYKKTGKSFCVYKLKHQDVDVSLPRRDINIGAGHKDFLVEGDPYMSFKEAASRRDARMNSIGFCLVNKVFLDPFGGASDLSSSTLSPVNINCFDEDPLRILRFAQLSARFELNVSVETYKIWAQKPYTLRGLPFERIQSELFKLIHAKKPSIGLAVLKKINTLSDITTYSVEIDRFKKIENRLGLICFLLGKDSSGTKQVCNAFNLQRLHQVVFLSKNLLNAIKQKHPEEEVQLQGFLLRRASLSIYEEIATIFCLKVDPEEERLASIKGSDLINLKEKGCIKQTSQVLKDLVYCFFKERVGVEHALKKAFQKNGWTTKQTFPLVF